MPRAPFPDDASAFGWWVDKLFYLSFYMTGAAFVAVVGILGYFMVKYRERPGHRALYHHGDTPKALGLLAALVLALQVVDWTLAYQDHRAWKAVFEAVDDAEALDVKVLAERYTWTFKYPGPDGAFGTDDDVEAFELHVPSGRRVRLEITSKDVVHSLFLPAMRIKMDAVPGFITRLHFLPRKLGEFEVACAEHCGPNHFQMQARLVVQTAEEFEEWLESEKEGF